MNNLTQQQMLELAKKSCPRLDAGAPDPQIGNHRRVMVFDCRNHEMGWFDFDPKIDGTVEQMADALRVIVAAFQLSDEWNLRLFHGMITFELKVDERDRYWRTTWGPDLLTASAKALIASRGKG